MLEMSNNKELPAIPGKRYFTIGEVSQLCGVKAHTLRYWEEKFHTLKPMKRRGNRRYYQRQDVILIRQIRFLLHEKGYTVEGANQKLYSIDEIENYSTASQASQLVHQLINDLEEVLSILKDNTSTIQKKGLKYKKKIVENKSQLFDYISSVIKENNTLLSYNKKERKNDVILERKELVNLISSVTNKCIQQNEKVVQINKEIDILLSRKQFKYTPHVTKRS